MFWDQWRFQRLSSKFFFTQIWWRLVTVMSRWERINKSDLWLKWKQQSWLKALTLLSRLISEAFTLLRASEQPACQLTATVNCSGFCFTLQIFAVVNICFGLFWIDFKKPRWGGVLFRIKTLEVTLTFALRSAWVKLLRPRALISPQTFRWLMKKNHLNPWNSWPKQKILAVGFISLWLICSALIHRRTTNRQTNSFLEASQWCQLQWKD